MPTLINPFRKGKREKKETGMEEEASRNQTFIKAMPLRELKDLETVKKEVHSGNVVILKVTPLATKSIEDVKKAVNELCAFVASIGGDIARLGEERVVVCPPQVKIWRTKTTVASEPVPTAI